MSDIITVEDTRPSTTKMIWAFSVILISYGVAIGVAVGIGWLLQGLMHPIWLTLIANVGATIVIFIFSVLFSNVSFYDPYWSVQPIVIVIYWFFIATPYVNPIRQAVVLGCVSFWGLRLTVNWIRGWKGLQHEDWRYVKYRKEKPKLFQIISFTGLQMMPTLIVYLGCISIYPALVYSNTNFNFLDIIGIIITVGATLIELLADEQMRMFLKMNNDSNKVMTLGLWGYSRHPNYFGEISFWWGLFFFSLAADFSMWWTISGPIAMIILFVFISVPLTENKQLAKRPEYTEYKRTVSMLIPWFPRN
ncbi:MAG TPA: DUF1295 domain-containing protein [candidate division Zixibacteria bacterium]|nr:DUF1295 domain-containing protein [candidate division Zixibacteria bacterium]